MMIRPYKPRNSARSAICCSTASTGPSKKSLTSRPTCVALMGARPLPLGDLSTDSRTLFVNVIHEEDVKRVDHFSMSRSELWAQAAVYYLAIYLWRS
jgi:hypothetical protein